MGPSSPCGWFLVQDKGSEGELKKFQALDSWCWGFGVYVKAAYGVGSVHFRGAGYGF